MKLAFTTAIDTDAPALAALHSAVAEDLTRRFGHGYWASAQTEAVVLRALRKPNFSRVLIARANNRIVGTLHLATKKPWAIDTAYFTPVKTALYLTNMAVHPDVHRKSVGRQLMKEVEAVALAWPADAIRLDAYDTKAGAEGFYAKCGFCEVGRVIYRRVPLVYFELVLAR